ncbi:hypothetical protein Lal_00021079 [Lupinus albus]|nr:hypothetical protein Lal_00021079 [Lupinus albus]
MRRRRRFVTAGRRRRFITAGRRRRDAVVPTKVRRRSRGANRDSSSVFLRQWRRRFVMCVLSDLRFLEIISSMMNKALVVGTMFLEHWDSSDEYSVRQLNEQFLMSKACVYKVEED